MDDLLGIAGDVGALLKARGETVAVAESSAGGLVSAALLAVPGASRYFVAGGVVYTQTAREVIAEIGAADMAGTRSSSEPYAALLADRMRLRCGTTWGLAETGAAGPSGNRYGDPAGHTCVAVAGPAQTVDTLRTGEENRAQNMRAFARHALERLKMALETQS